MTMHQSILAGLETWCQENGWTDLFVERYQYWAFPPGAVMPLPIPQQVMQSFQLDQPLSLREKLGYGGAIAGTLAAGVLSYASHCPMPLIFAFAFSALTVAFLEDQSV